MQPLRRTQYRGFNSSAPKGETRSLSEKRFFSRLPLCQITLSFHLRDSADTPPFTFGTRLTGILQSRIHL